MESGPPKELFQTRINLSPVWDQYAMTADAQKFIAIEPVDEGPQPIHVVLNWNAGVKR